MIEIDFWQLQHILEYPNLDLLKVQMKGQYYLMLANYASSHFCRKNTGDVGISLNITDLNYIPFETEVADLKALDTRANKFKSRNEYLERITSQK